MEFRKIAREEVKWIWDIDRSEFVESVYVLRDSKLIERRIDFDAEGWSPGEEAKYTPILENCFARGGFFYGVFENSRIIAVVVLESRFIGKNADQLQLKFLHIGRAFRNRGIGKRLFITAANEARRRGAEKLYISSCESKNTVDFYTHLGCALAEEIDDELYKLEPNDIHLTYQL